MTTAFNEDTATVVQMSRPESIDLAEEMDNWIKEYCKGELKIIGYSTSSNITELDVMFEIEEEAMLFKLRWL